MYFVYPDYEQLKSSKSTYWESFNFQFFYTCFPHENKWFKTQHILKMIYIFIFSNTYEFLQNWDEGQGYRILFEGSLWMMGVTFQILS